jgi:glycosyltransferase involved in cell wall biosynthesis
MRCPNLVDLPDPPPGKAGWPWTIETPRHPDTMSDGSPWPRISIVTPSFNQGQYLEETIRSVLLQGYPNLEYFIMDGGSTDGSVEIIRKYETWLSHWESGKDGGQAAAINKGLRLSQGEWFQNINSDDVLLGGALAIVGQTPDRYDICCGNVQEFSPAHTYLVGNRNIKLENLIRLFWRTARASWHQPGVFLRTKNLKTLGGYNESLQYAFDLHLTCRYVERFPAIRYTGSTLTKFRVHDNAKSSAWGTVYEAESIRARELLAKDLERPRNRQLAAVEAARRKLVKILANADGTELEKEVRAIVAAFPSLGVDRMLLGNIRRRPLSWARALLQSR